MTRKIIGFTSDWHIGHLNSITFDKRPFKDLDHMHSVLVNNYGICYFLGDVGMSSSESVKDVIGRLNGTKVLILGNHDKGNNAMYDIGFDVVTNNVTLYIAGQRVTLSHCPLPGLFREDTTGMRNCEPGDMWHGEKRHRMYSVTDEGQFHLHGHIHSNPTNGKLKIDATNRQYDVGVPANNYRPVSISTIESWIARTK
jgi:calcineurin-like phosphoesterase family protein